MTSTSALVDLAALVLLATASVGLWTLRIVVTAKGRNTAAATIAAIEAIVFLVAFSRAVAGLTAPERVGAYAVGVGLGTLLGLAVDRRLNPRHAQVEVVAPGPANETRRDSPDGLVGAPGTHPRHERRAFGIPS
jgi:uncharacterized protein YebE (UPF0316 family)